MSAPAAEPAPASARSVLSRPALSYLVLAATLAVFTNLAMFQALLPAEIARSGGTKFEVGIATSLFSAGTVACELVTAALATRFALVHLLAAGTFVIGAGTFCYVFAGHSIPALLALTAVRGGAFGIAVVTTSYLVAAYADPAQRGRALGVYGFCVSLPAAFGISLGLVIQSTAGPATAYVLGAAPALLMGAALAAVLGRSSPPPVAPPEMRARHLPPLLATGAVISLVTMTYGGLLSFGPILVGGAATVLFLGFGIARTAARPLAGLLCDRVGGFPVLLVSLLALGAGCALLDLGGAPAATAAGSLYGIGLGGVSNAAYVLMLERSNEGAQALVSTAWSTAFDSGVVAGGIVFASCAQLLGARGVALLFPALAVLPLVVSLLDRGAGRPLRSAA